MLVITSFTFGFVIMYISGMRPMEESRDAYLHECARLAYQKSLDDQVKDSLVSVCKLPEADARVYAEIIKNASTRFNIDWRWLVAKLMVESTFDPFAISKATRGSPREQLESAYGLMQIKPSTARDITKHLNFPWSGQAYLFNPYYSVMLGACYMAELKVPLGNNFEATEKAYNNGIANYYAGKVSEEHWQKVSEWHEKLKPRSK